MGKRFYLEAMAIKKSLDSLTGHSPERELQFLHKFVRPNDQVVDLGACTGLYSVPLARLVGANGKVFAFEPVPETFHLLKRVCTFLGVRGRTKLLNMAVGDVDSQVEISVPLREEGYFDPGLSHLSMRKNLTDEKSADAFGRLKIIRQKMIKLDSMIDEFSNLTFIKMDIEGAELKALRGMSTVVDQFRPSILMEYTIHFLKGMGEGAADFEDWLSLKRYSAFQLVGDRLRHASRPLQTSYLFLLPEEKLSRWQEFIESV